MVRVLYDFAKNGLGYILGDFLETHLATLSATRPPAFLDNASTVYLQH
jgi:hypothetical protein